MHVYVYACVCFWFNLILPCSINYFVFSPLGQRKNGKTEKNGRNKKKKKIKEKDTRKKKRNYLSGYENNIRIDNILCEAVPSLGIDMDT